MASVHNLYAECGYRPHSPPLGAKKPYVARILGRDSKKTFRREYLGRDVYVDTPGLYQIRNVNCDGEALDEYVLILRVHEDKIHKHSVKIEDAMKIARLLDERQDIEKVAVPNGIHWAYWTPPSRDSESSVCESAQC